MAFSVFVSYSHNDVALVTPIMELLRLNKALVFQDTARLLTNLIDKLSPRSKRRYFGVISQLDN